MRPAPLICLIGAVFGGVVGNSRNRFAAVRDLAAREHHLTRHMSTEDSSWQDPLRRTPRPLFSWDVPVAAAVRQVTEQTATTPKLQPSPIPPPAVSGTDVTRNRKGRKNPKKRKNKGRTHESVTPFERNPARNNTRKVRPIVTSTERSTVPTSGNKRRKTKQERKSERRERNKERRRKKHRSEVNQRRRERKKQRRIFDARLTGLQNNTLQSKPRTAIAGMESGSQNSFLSSSRMGGAEPSRNDSRINKHKKRNKGKLSVAHTKDSEIIPRNDTWGQTSSNMTYFKNTTPTVVPEHETTESRNQTDKAGLGNKSSMFTEHGTFTDVHHGSIISETVRNYSNPEGRHPQKMSHQKNKTDTVKHGNNTVQSSDGESIVTVYNPNDCDSQVDSEEENTLTIFKESSPVATRCQTVLIEGRRLSPKSQDDDTAYTNNVDNSGMHTSSWQENTTASNETRGDLSCLVGAFVPAPPVVNAAIKYTRTQMSILSYLEAQYDCVPGYRMYPSSKQRLMCKNREWLGTVPECIEDSTLKLGITGPVCTSNNEACEQICHQLDGKPVCLCYKGFKPDGQMCRDVNECEVNNGGCAGKCQNAVGSYQCQCPGGLRLSVNGKSCLDVNECLLRNGHGPCQDSCTNTHGGYTCSCEGLPGTRLASDNHTCEDVDECSAGTAGCSHTCLNTLGRVFCLCPAGMQLGNDWKTCQDIDECKETYLQTEPCDTVCINTVGSYHCGTPSSDTLCPFGVLRSDGSCEDIDECSTGDCFQNTEEEKPLPTTSLPPPVTCAKGFHLDEYGLCEDTNECANASGGCAQICMNTLGSYKCSCISGFALDIDGKTCIDTALAAVCPPLDTPPRGYLHCKRHPITSPPRGLFGRGRRRVINHAGSVCELHCPQGYQLVGSYRQTCTQQGFWAGPQDGTCVSSPMYYHVGLKHIES